MRSAAKRAGSSGTRRPNVLAPSARGPSVTTAAREPLVTAAARGPFVTSGAPTAPNGAEAGRHASG